MCINKRIVYCASGRSDVTQVSRRHLVRLDIETKTRVISMYNSSKKKGINTSNKLVVRRSVRVRA